MSSTPPEAPTPAWNRALETARRLVVRGSRVARNALFDLRDGSLLGFNELRRGRRYSNSDYRALERIFAGRIRPDDVLVDVGCGLGRVISWWQRCAPGQRMIGIEIDPETADAARRRLRKHPNVTIITGDASAELPEDGTLFFLFNSFLTSDEWAPFNERLVSLHRGDPRVRIFCQNCANHLEAFGDDAWEVAETVDLGGDRTAPFGTLTVLQMRG